MYPLHDNFIPPIDAIIEKLNAYSDLQVQTFATATVLQGEYGAVMRALNESIAWSYENHGKAVFAIKLIPGYEPDG